MQHTHEHALGSSNVAHQSDQSKPSTNTQPLSPTDTALSLSPPPLLSTLTSIRHLLRSYSHWLPWCDTDVPPWRPILLGLDLVHVDWR